MAKSKGKTVVVKHAGITKNETKGAASVTIAKPSTAGGENFYENSLKELQVVASNDTYAKKVDNGVLNEGRGKDVWRLHTTLKAIDDVGTTLWDGVMKARDEVHKNSSQIVDLVESTKNAISSGVSRSTTSLSDKLEESTHQLDKAVEKVHNAVSNGFSKLAQATAGTEENLRTQTSAFSKEVASLLAELQGMFDKSIREFRDESTRLIDKRFNQSDVAFAAVRADQEVIKALLTDIIKDRMGRPDPRNR